MTWLRQSDDETLSPRYDLVSGSRAERQRVLGMAWELKEHCARHRTDGFLTPKIFAEILTPKYRRSFTDGDQPLIHVRPDDGALPVCCDYGITWSPDTPYLWHGFLRDNMTSAEADVAAAKRAELRDAELKHAVRTRDRDRCRYCGRAVVWADRRSVAGGVFDHVDPARANGAANLVVACRQCNSVKGRRRPETAGMRLLPIRDESTDPYQVEPLTDPIGTGRATDARPRENPYLRDWRDPFDHASEPWPDDDAPEPPDDWDSR